jgi:5-methyltetrahydrofolate--homocysteine methyltransferase
LLGNKNIVVSTLKELIAQGVSPLDLVNSCIVSALNEAGGRYDKKEYFLPQLLMAAEAAQTGLAYLHPLLQETGAQPQGTVVLATVKGDIHDIGKSIVKLMLENHGFSVIDLGKDVEPSLIVETALSNQADIIALSALMTTTMPQMQVVCQMLEEKKVFIPVLVGGAIVNAEYAQEIGATYGADATDAVRLALKLLKKEGGT